MNLLRKLELIGGVLIAAIGLFVTLSYVRIAQQISERLEREFVIKNIIVLSLVFLLPGLAVLLGSFLHSMKKMLVGQFLLIIGSLASLFIFLLFLLSPSPNVLYGRLDLFWLSFLSAALAILTSIISFLVQRQR